MGESRNRWSCRNTQGRRIRRIWVSAAIAAAVLIGGCSRRQPDPAPARPKEDIRRCIRGEPASLDPQTAGDTISFEVLRDLFEGLTAESASGEIVPGVAQNWSVSSDGLRYEFDLRPQAEWSNGDIVTAAEFVAALQRAVDPATGSPEAELLKPIRGAQAIIAGKAPPTTLGVRAEGEHKLLIELTAPAPYFPAILANAVAYPVYRGVPAASGPSRRGPAVSNGAYVLAEWVPGGKLTLRPAGTTRMACPKPDGVMDQEREFLKALETVATARFEGDRLELRTASDALAAMLVRAAES